jgi:thymidylate synthase
MSERDFLAKLDHVLNNGSRKEIFGHPDRYLLSVFGGQPLRFDLSKGFPVMTTRRTAWKSAIKNKLWEIEGSGDVAKLRRSGVSVWDEWGLKNHNKKNSTQLTQSEWCRLVDAQIIESEILPLHYMNISHRRYVRILESIEDDSASSPTGILGFESMLDQARWVITNMVKTPFRKSFHVDIWQPETVYQMADECGNPSVMLPACWHSHTLNFNDGKLNMSVLGRSWDIWTAGAWNIVEFSALLHMYAHCMQMSVGFIEFYTTDTHLYSNLLEPAVEQMFREPYQFPQLKILDRGQKFLQDFVIDDFTLTDYKSYPSLKGEVTVVGGY